MWWVLSLFEWLVVYRMIRTLLQIGSHPSCCFPSALLESRLGPIPWVTFLRHRLKEFVVMHKIRRSIYKAWHNVNPLWASPLQKFIWRPLAISTPTLLPFCFLYLFCRVLIFFPERTSLKHQSVKDDAQTDFTSLVFSSFLHSWLPSILSVFCFHCISPRGIVKIRPKMIMYWDFSQSNIPEINNLKRTTARLYLLFRSPGTFSL